MAFNVQTAGLLTTGTTGPDYFIVASGAVQAATIQGLAGNDSVVIEDGASSATGVRLDLVGGADSIVLSGGVYSASNILPGAGGDTVTIHAGSHPNSTINGGDGNDLISLTSAGFSSSRIVLGGGIDTLRVSGAGADISKTFIGAGAGSDILDIQQSGEMNQTEILGGGGNDSITVSGIVSGAGFEINGDSSANGGGSDTITFNATLSASTIRGKGGADLITVTSMAGTGVEVLGNAGGDTISLAGTIADVTGALIGAGSGNDSITLSGTVGVLGDLADVKAGGGSDTIQLKANDALANISGQIFGGAGADSINLISAAFSGGSVAYEALSESTLTTMDSILVSGGEGIVGLGSGEAGGSPTLTGELSLSFSAVTVNLTTGIAAGVGFNGVSNDGLLQSGDFTDQGTTAAGLTARATLVDGQSSTLGETFAFEDGSDNVYLFIQGGSAGLSDDLLVNVGSADNFSGGGVTMQLVSGAVNFAS